MQRFLSATVLSSTLALGLATIVLAQPFSPMSPNPSFGVQRSGNVFHRASCDGPVQPLVARCHAHLVTDARGNDYARDAAPYITPSGFSPAQLRSAYSITTNGSSTTTIAIVDAYGYNNAESDLAVYRSQFGLPPC